MTADLENTSKTSDEVKSVLIDKLSNKISSDFVKKQQQILEDAIYDIAQKPKEIRKFYTYQQYTNSISRGIPNANYCLSVNMYAFEKADEELGRKIAEELKSISGEAYVNESKASPSDSLNIFFNKPKSNLDSVYDTLGTSYKFNCNTFINKFGNSPYMENGIVNAIASRNNQADVKLKDSNIPGVLAAGCSSDVKVSDFVEIDHQVRLNENGQPKLKDGDILLIQTRVGNENSTGFHAVRANVDENGKVTYSAGNNEAIRKELPNQWRNSPIVVFHTQDYVRDCTKEALREYDMPQLEALMIEQGLRKPFQRVESVELAETLKTNATAMSGTRTELAMQTDFADKNAKETASPHKIQELRGLSNSGNRDRNFAETFRQLQKESTQFAEKTEPKVTAQAINDKIAALRGRIAWSANSFRQLEGKENPAAIARNEQANKLAAIMNNRRNEYA